MGQAKNRKAEINELKSIETKTLTNEAAFLIRKTQLAVKHMGWTEGYECPEYCSMIIEAGIMVCERERSGFDKSEVLQSILEFREDYENTIAPRFGIDLTRLRSIDSDSEIALITDPATAFRLGVLDAIVGALAVKRVSVSGLYEHYAV